MEIYSDILLLVRMTKGKSRIIQHPLSDYPLPSSTVIKAFGGLVIFRAIAGNITVSFYYVPEQSIMHLTVPS